MPEQDAAPDPIDKAYAHAQAVFDDEAARAARRARVLGAVAAAPSSANAGPAKRPLLWGQGRWLAAASVAGFGLLIGLKFYPPPATPPQAPPSGRAPAGVSAAHAPSAPMKPATPPAKSSVRPHAGPARSAAQSEAPRDGQGAPAQPPAQASAAASAPAPVTKPAPLAQATPPAPASSGDTLTEQIVVTGSHLRSQEPATAARDAGIQDVLPFDVAASAARLRSAAESGRVSELTALLNQGTPVDAVDEQGESALIKAVRANQPAAAALLRRRGASLDLKNRAGLSARDIAASSGESAMKRALGVRN